MSRMSGEESGEGRIPTPRMALGGTPSTHPSYLLGVAAAASALPYASSAQANHHNSLLQLAAIQQIQQQQQTQYLQQLQAAAGGGMNNLNAALAAVYYNQLLAGLGQPQSPSAIQAPPPPAPQPPSRNTLHPAVVRIASEGAGPRRRSAPVIPAEAPQVMSGSRVHWSPETVMEEEAGPSQSKPLLSSPKAIQEHIDALISKNEAIVLPQAPLLQKRRTYQRHPMGPDGKPYLGLGSPPKAKQTAGRSTSLIEGQLGVNLQLQQQRSAHLNQFHRGSLPSQLVYPSASHGLVLGGPQIPTEASVAAAIAASSTVSFKCQHCGLDFPNDLNRQAHVFRCSRNMGALAAPRPELPALVPETSRLPLSGTLSLDPASILRLQHQHQLAAILAQQELQQHEFPSAVAAAVPTPKSQHPLKKRILAEHAVASQAQPTPPKQPKLEVAEKAVGPSTSAVLRRPVATHVAPPTQKVPEPPAALPQASPPQAPPVLSLSVQLSAAEKAQNFTPYTRTVQVDGSDRLEAPRSGRRPRHVTAPTFVCMKRPQPFFLPHSDPKRSMYSTWQQVAVNPVEAKLNLLWMGGCCTRPKRGSHPFWKYTTADKELSVPRMTHSSFADFSRKLLAAQALEEAKPSPAAEGGAPDLWTAVAADNADRLDRKASSRLLSVDSNASEDSEQPGRLQISQSPQTSDTEDACEIEEDVPQAKTPTYVSSELTGTTRRFRRRRSTQTPPPSGVSVCPPRRDCASLPPLSLAWTPTLTAPPLLCSPVKGSAGLPPPAAKPKLSPFLVSTGRLECRICDKKFSKTELLRLHMNTHYYQESTVRRKAHLCPICGMAQLSRAALQKHAATAHGELEKPRDASAASNPRPFKCGDCETAFRGQGFLQKHLRSKLHVMKLECTGKLPFGTFALFESANFNLAEIDTTDCESSLTSMRAHAETLQAKFPAFAPVPSADEKEKTEPLKMPGTSSLVCTEEAPPPSPPPPPAAPRPQAEDDGADGNGKCVTADVWVPPKEEEVMKTLPPPSKSFVSPPKALPTPKNDQASSEESADSEAAAAGPVVAIATPTHVCRFCKLQAASATDLEVHLHADHIAMKDGNDFRCPRPNCDKIYPSRESLRLHIAAHYLGGTAVQSGLASMERDGDVSRETMAALQRKLGAGGAPGPSSAVPPAGTVGSQSPGTPEESQTSFAAVSGGRKKMKTHLVALNSIPEATAAADAVASPLSDASDASTPSPHDATPKTPKVPRGIEALSGRRCASALDPAALCGGLGSPSFSLPALPAQLIQQAPLSLFRASGLLAPPSVGLSCPMCGLGVADVGGLQAHLFTHVSSRPHVCSLCDAGFTTKAALDAHASSHTNGTESSSR